MSLIASLALLSTALLQNTLHPIKEGYIQVPDGQVYYRIVGHGSKPPLLVLHGGPGIPHNYLQTLDALADDRAVIYYDQLGCGMSDRPDNPKLWTIPHFCQELAAVRKELWIKECYVLGHSWGTILATEAVLRGAKGIKGLILAGPAMNLNRWQKDADRLVSEMPTKERHILQEGGRTGKFDSPQYQAAMMAYYGRHVLRIQPWPQIMQDTFAGIRQQVYMTMAGPNEFVATGTLKGYDSTARLRKIKLPTLLICGEFDEATPGATRTYHDAIPGSQMVVLKGCSHLGNIEKPQVFKKLVEDFLEKH